MHVTHQQSAYQRTVLNSTVVHGSIITTKHSKFKNRKKCGNDLAGKLKVRPLKQNYGLTRKYPENKNRQTI